MNRFNTLFKDPNKKVLLPFFTLGDPNYADSLAIIKAAIDAGADALELGFAFSDPIADGPTNQRSMLRALGAGMNFKRNLGLLAEIRAYAPHLPIGLLLYYNLLHRRGEGAYRDLAEAGVDAVVVADLPIEESQGHGQALAKHGLGAIQMIAPNTDDSRAQSLFAASDAFTYVLSGYGTTGVKAEIDPRTLARVQQLRTLSAKPMVVGFGISQAAHVKAVWGAGANGAIVGSKFTQIIETHLNAPHLAAAEIAAFIRAAKE
jgi:tryptophan synthase alpha chain